MLRQFCRLYLQPAPDDSTLIRWAGFIEPDTLEQLNEHVVKLARQLRVTRGRKLRTDPTVVETNISYPRDSGLLRDGVRVISRVITRAKELVGTSIQNARTVFRNRTSSAKRLARQIADEARRRGQEAEAGRRATYQRLLKITEATLKQAETVQVLLQEGLAEESAAAVRRLQESLDQFVPLVKQVVTQTRRRVLEGEMVPATEKLVSIFEPHTQIIRRGKGYKQTEFGRKVSLDEVDGGIVSRYRVLEGNPTDDGEAPASLANHQRVFARPPNLFAGDRGVYSAENEVAAHQIGVKQVVLPQPGHKTKERKSHERQSWFRRGMRFRAGIEGRINVLKRRGNLGRCRDHGETGFGRWVGWGIMVANLQTIARTRAARS